MTVITGDKAKLLLQMMAAEAAAEGGNDFLPPAMTARRLLDHYADLSVVHKFEPGMLIQRKEELNQNTRLPGKGQPGIVTKVYNPPLLAQNAETGSCNFGTTHDIRVMVLHEDGFPVEFAFDSRFFEPYTGKIE